VAQGYEAARYAALTTWRPSSSPTATSSACKTDRPHDRFGDSAPGFSDQPRSTGRLTLRRAVGERGKRPAPPSGARGRGQRVGRDHATVALHGRRRAATLARDHFRSKDEARESAAGSRAWQRLKAKIALVIRGAKPASVKPRSPFHRRGKPRSSWPDIQDDRGRKSRADVGARATYVHADVSRETDGRGDGRREFVASAGLTASSQPGSGGVHGRIDEIGVEASTRPSACCCAASSRNEACAPVMKRQGTGRSSARPAWLDSAPVSGPTVLQRRKAAVIRSPAPSRWSWESGVRVNCICPGGIATPIFRQGFGLSPTRAGTRRSRS